MKIKVREPNPRRGWRVASGLAFGLLPLRLKRIYLFVRAHKRLPRVSRPRTFTEKVNWRILRDRRPWVALACDKLSMKDEARRRTNLAQTIPTLWTGRDVAEIVGMDLPDHWVLKPNHGSTLVCLGRGAPGTSDLPALEAATTRWLKYDRWRSAGEWGYGGAQRTLLLEPMIGGGPDPPPDFKGYVFNGRLHFWHVDTARGGGPTRAFLSRDGNQLDFELRHPAAGRIEAPDALAEMNRAAEEIAGGVDFARVDLYLAEEQIWFGELTVYPGGGLVAPSPPGTDELWGDLWDLPDLR